MPGERAVRRVNRYGQVTTYTVRSLVEEGKILHYDFSDWYGSDVGMRVKDVCPPPLKLAQQVRMAEAMPNQTRGVQ